MTDRIRFIDGYRGIAILLVILFHSYSRWPGLYPYADSYSEIILFKYGSMGVQLFFLISGFVILMSMENTNGFGRFIYKRWLRLFPAMLICSVIIYSTAPFFTERQQGHPNILSIMPGLLFIEPEWLSYFLKTKIAPLESSFWSLYVEMKFYIFAASVYFIRRNSKDVLVGLIIVYSSAISILFARGFLHSAFIDSLSEFIYQLSLHRFGLFAAGASLYYSKKHNSDRWFFIGLAISFASFTVLGIGKHNDFHFVLLGIGISSIFFATFKSQMLQRILSNRYITFLGFISYPLYLIHDNMLVSSIAQIGRTAPVNCQCLIPLIPFFFLILVAFTVASRLEPALKNLILKAIQIYSKGIRASRDENAPSQSPVAPYISTKESR